MRKLFVAERPVSQVIMIRFIVMVDPVHLCFPLCKSCNSATRLSCRSGDFLCPMTL